MTLMRMRVNCQLIWKRMMKEAKIIMILLNMTLMLPLAAHLIVATSELSLDNNSPVFLVS